MSEWRTGWETPPEPKPVVKIGDDTIEVEKTANFVETIMNIAKERGIKRFEVFADGREITQTNPPTDFTDIRVVEIKPLDEAGH